MKYRRFSSRFLAVGIALAVVLWFWSGIDAPEGGSTSTPEQDVSRQVAAAAFLVDVTTIHAESVTREERLQGYTAPDRQVTVRAETAGRVEAILVERGAMVSEGQAIVRLAADDKPAQLRRASALLVRRENEYSAALRLKEQQLMAQTQVDESLANLEAARAELAQIELSIEKTTVRAPFDGVLNARQVELGDFVGMHDSVFTVVDIDPLVVVANVSQGGQGGIRVGAESNVSLVTGETALGRVRYRSAVADEATRTFKVEIEIDNRERGLLAGVSAEAFVPTGEIAAHRIAPGWLVRTSDGEVGIYAADSGIATFWPVTIVRSAPESIWVTGLSGSLDIVTSGQGFLEDGQAVRLAADSISGADLGEAAPIGTPAAHFEHTESK